MDIYYPHIDYICMYIYIIKPYHNLENSVKIFKLCLELS